MYDQFEDDWTPKLPLQVYLQHLKHSEELDHITSRSKLHYLPDKKNYKTEKTSIGFDLANASTQVATQFNGHVSDDLRLRGIRGRTLGNAKQRRDHLLERLVLARDIRKVRNTLEKEEAALMTRLVKIHRFATCILHLENRTSECVSREGIKAALKGLQGDNKKEIIALVETEMNKTVFGKTDAAGQWKIPFENGKVANFSFCNQEAREVCDHLANILDTIHVHIKNEGLRTKWKEALHFFSSFMKLLRSRKPFTVTDILHLQNLIDCFFDIWHVIVGRDGYGNYMHCLDVGHVAEQLFIHGNLYLLSQQGWEAVNKKAKKIFFTKTSMGGGKGKYGKLLPILELFLRELYWRFGWADELFVRHVYPRKEGEKYQPLNIVDCYHQPALKSSGPKKVSDATLEGIVDSIISLGSEFDLPVEEGKAYFDELRESNDARYELIMNQLEKYAVSLS